jgi:hypothetical protein
MSGGSAKERLVDAVWALTVNDVKRLSVYHDGVKVLLVMRGLVVCSVTCVKHLCVSGDGVKGPHVTMLVNARCGRRKAPVLVGQFQVTGTKHPLVPS